MDGHILFFSDKIDVLDKAVMFGMSIFGRMISEIINF